MWTRPGLVQLALRAACKAQLQGSRFPDPERPVAPIVSPRYSNEDARDSVGEAETVMRLAGIQPGMWVADIGAGDPPPTDPPPRRRRSPPRAAAGEHRFLAKGGGHLLGPR